MKATIYLACLLSFLHLQRAALPRSLKAVADFYDREINIDYAHPIQSYLREAYEAAPNFFRVRQIECEYYPEMPI